MLVESVDLKQIDHQLILQQKMDLFEISRELQFGSATRVSYVNHKLALAMGPCHLPLCGLNRVLL